uniref:TsaA-like domain-containing protein n=1 Tax=Cucumis melo TaxID=3656 RepID=A0A9I9E0B1_CUCME
MPIILEYAAAPTISLRTGLSDRLLFPTVLRRSMRMIENETRHFSLFSDFEINVLGYPKVKVLMEKMDLNWNRVNGTPRQSLLVPLARARLVFSACIPPASIEGIGEYSHCSVREPRLKVERVGVFATRSPHRPCPIGLTVAKVEAVQGHEILLSGADLVDGIPVLDVKPYLPYCDSVQDATISKWLLLYLNFLTKKEIYNMPNCGWTTWWIVCKMINETLRIDNGNEY